MSALRDGSGRTILLGSEIGRGGEAVIWTVAGRPDQVAKIWHEPATAERAGKLAAMLADPPQDPAAARGHVSIPWPTSPVTDDAGVLRGFLMPRLGDGKRIFEVFNPVRRRQTAPGWDERYLYRAARNLASVVESIHRKGYVIGDLNESNVLVAPTALVSVVDTDSFQVPAVVDGQPVVYHCRVGKPEYVAPELQGKPLATTVRTPAMDRFALAVLIFQLLTDGNHPFRLRWTGGGEQPSLEQSISRNLYPHGDAARTAPIAPPPGMLPVSALDPVLQTLFERAFVDGHDDPDARPTAEEWAAALAAAETGLVACGKGHYYDRRNPECPECAAEAATVAARAGSATRARSGTRSRPSSAAAGRSGAGSTASPPTATNASRSAAMGGSVSGNPPLRGGASAPVRGLQGKSSTRASQRSPGQRIGYLLAGLLAKGLRAAFGHVQPPTWSRQQIVGLVVLAFLGFIVLVNSGDPDSSPRTSSNRRVDATATVRVQRTATATAAARATGTGGARQRPQPTPDVPMPGRGEYGAIRFADDFSPAGRAFVATGGRRVSTANGVLIVEASGDPAVATARLRTGLDPDGDLAVDARVRSVTGDGAAVLGLEDAAGRQLLLAVDPVNRTWRLGTRAGDARAEWLTGPASRPLPARAPATGDGTTLELRAVEGRVVALVDGVPLHYGDPETIRAPFDVVVGAAQEQSLGPEPARASFDSVRARDVVSESWTPVFATDFAETDPPRALAFDTPGLSGDEGGGRLLLVDGHEASEIWVSHPVGPVVSAGTVAVEVDVGEVRNGMAALVLRGQRGRTLRVFVQPERRNWTYDLVEAHRRVTEEEWQRLPGDGSPIETIGVVRTPDWAWIVIDGVPMAWPSGASLRFEEAFQTELGVYTYQTDPATAEFRSLRIDALEEPGDAPAIRTAPAATPVPTATAPPAAGATLARFVEDFSQPDPAEDLLPTSPDGPPGRRGAGELFLHAEGDTTAAWRWDRVLPDGDIVAEADIAALAGDGIATLTIAGLDGRAAVMMDIDTEGKRWRVRYRGERGGERINPWIASGAAPEMPVRLGLRVASGFVSARAGAGDWMDIAPAPHGFHGPFAVELSATMTGYFSSPAEVRFDRLSAETTAPVAQAGGAGASGAALPTAASADEQRDHDGADGQRTVLFNEDFGSPTLPRALQFAADDQTGRIGNGSLVIANGNPGVPALYELDARIAPVRSFDVEAFVTPVRGPGSALLGLRAADGHLVSVLVDETRGQWSAEVRDADGHATASTTPLPLPSDVAAFRRLGFRIEDGNAVPTLGGVSAPWPAGSRIPTIEEPFGIALGVESPQGRTTVVFTGVIVRGDDSPVSGRMDDATPASGASPARFGAGPTNALRPGR